MKLQPASKKEVIRIAVGSAFCLAVMIAAFFVLSLFEILKFDYTVILGGIAGTAIAVGNFAVLCLTIQNAAQTDNKKTMKAKFQVSYNLRLVLQAAWVVAAFLLPWIHVIAAAVPLLFPTIVICFFRSWGKLAIPSIEEQDKEENPESFGA